jgi:AhpD family alkylhydroperoxidase
MLQAMCLRPDLLRGFAALSAAVYPGGVVERSVKEMVILEASQRNRCQFCLNSHIAIVQEMGLSDQPLSLLDNLDGLTPRERAAVRYTRAALEDSNAIPETVWEDMRGAFTEPEIVEVTAMIGLINMLNMFNNCLEVRYRGEYGMCNGVTPPEPPRKTG